MLEARSSSVIAWMPVNPAIEDGPASLTCAYLPNNHEYVSELKQAAEEGPANKPNTGSS